MNSGGEVAANLARASDRLAQAVAEGARIVVLPENFAWCARDEAARRALARPVEDSPLVQWLCEASARHGVAIVGAGLPLAGREAGKVQNAAVAVEDGRVRAVYAKMHLFDVELPDESWRESAHTEAGAHPVVVELAGVSVALAVCYDLRFPELFRAAAGCELIALGAAFTVPTGRAHWEVLVRARAIENQCYVAAAAQWGRHPGGRETYGHTMIAGPWGEVLACRPEGEGIVVAELDRARLVELRRRLPALAHRRAIPPAVSC